MTWAIGIDLGGTNLRVALFRDLSRRTAPVREHREPVGEARGPAQLADRLAGAVTRIAGDDAPAAAVGIGIAAMLRGRDGMVANSPHLRWRDVAFGELMRARLPDRRLGIYNDVNAITYGEFALGAGRGASDVVGVFVGTGIGAGIVANGELVDGATNSGAEIGHVKVAVGRDARPCNCGLRGCVEAYAGGSYLLERIRGELASGVKSAITVLAAGEAPNPGHVDRAALDGDPYAVGLWNEVGPLLGLALANVVTVLNPARLVLGGGVLSHTPRLREIALTSLRELANPPALEALTIVDAELGDNAGLVGSALLASRASAPPG
jgi:glucokinase